ARVEAQAALEQQRLAQEMQIRAMEAQKKRPTALIAVAGVLVLTVGLLGFWAYNKSQESERKEKEAAARIAALEQEMDKTQAEINQLIKEKEAAFQQMLAAKTEEEKAAAQRALDEKNRQLKAKQDALKGLKDKAKRRGSSGGGGSKPKQDQGVSVNCDPNDPLCGL